MSWLLVIQVAMKNEWRENSSINLWSRYALLSFSSSILSLLSSSSIPSSVPSFPFILSFSVFPSLFHPVILSCFHFLVTCRRLTFLVLFFFFNQGSWVLLHNAHNAPRLLAALDSFMHETKSVDPEFRLWVSVLPNPDISSSLLQTAVKLVADSPLVNNIVHIVTLLVVFLVILHYFTLIDLNPLFSVTSI